MSTGKYKDPSDQQWKPLQVPPHTHPAESSRLVGEVVAYAGLSAPAGWLICDGAAYPTATYPDLAAVLGTTYGTPGAGLFALPDLRARSIVGPGGAPGSPGATGGLATHDHPGQALAAHTHTAAAHTHAGNALPTHFHVDPEIRTDADTHTHSVNPAATTSGSGGSHSHSIGNDNGGFVTIQPGGTDDVARRPHSHSAGSGGSHTHSVDIPATTSASDVHDHTTVAHNVSAVSAGTPSVQSTAAGTPSLSSVSAGTPDVDPTTSYHPYLVLNAIIYAG